MAFTRVVFALLVFCPVATQAQRSFDTNILTETFGYDQSAQRAVELSELMQGCPRRDCIPSIDAPKFVPAAEAEHVADEDSVVAIALNGDVRAYPTRILDHHEIVNDTIGGEPIAVTWCPLCGSAVGVRRVLGGEVTQLGVSGLLYNSDLVFYDRSTGTLWDQIEATGIVGPLTGESLEFVAVTMTSWSRWRNAHPETLVLSPDTGFAFDYREDRYARYRSTKKLFMPVSHKSRRLHPKAVVYGFRLDSGPVAFAASLFDNEDTYEHDNMTVTRHDDGSVTLQADGNDIPRAPIRLFWFAWYTFNPDTELVN